MLGDLYLSKRRISRTKLHKLGHGIVKEIYYTEIGAVPIKYSWRNITTVWWSIYGPVMRARYSPECFVKPFVTENYCVDILFEYLTSYKIISESGM